MRHLPLLLSLTLGICLHAHSEEWNDIYSSTCQPNIPQSTCLKQNRTKADIPEQPAPGPIRKAPMRSAEDLEHLGNTTVDKLNYAVYGNNEETVATLLGWADPNDYTPHIVIPDKITFNGKDAFVTVINDNAFYNGWGITGVTIGANVKTIGMSAFYGCSIQSLTIPQGLRYILDYAFIYNPLQSVTFENPSSTDVPLVIGFSAFEATNLESFEVPARLRIEHELSFANDNSYGNFLAISFSDSKLKQITVNSHFSDINRDYSLEILNNALCCVNNENNHLMIIAYPPAASQKSFTIEAPCIDVLSYAMPYNNLETISLNATNGIRESKVNLIIGSEAFFRSKIKSLSLSANGPITLSGRFTLECYNLTAYTLSESITNYKVLDGVLYTNDSDKTLESYPANKSDIQLFTVPEDVIAIQAFAFFGNPHIEQVTLPAGLDWIGMSAFCDCKNLRYVTIAEGAELSDVGSYAFRNTPFIDEAPDGPIMLSDCLIGYKNIPEDLVLPSNMRHAAEALFYNNNTIKSVRFPADMPVIPNSMFQNCSYLSSIEWPENLEQINKLAFTCANIPNLELPQSCLKIGYGAFANCSNLQSIKIGDSDNARNGISGFIAPLAFSQATQCRSIQIGKGFRTIGSNAFSGAGSETESSAMMDIIIPEGVEEIGHFAFSSANNVGRLYLPSTLSRLGVNSFTFRNTPTEVQINRTTPPAELDIDGVSTIENPVNQIFDIATLLYTTLTIPLDAQPESFTKFSPWNFQHVVKKNLGSIAQVTADPCDLNVNGLTLTSANGAVIELFGIDGKLIDKGVSVTASGHGLHIVKVGNTVKKIIL